MVKRPYLMAFLDEVARPASEVGPVEDWALMALAVCCAEVLILVDPFGGAELGSLVKEITCGGWGIGSRVLFSI